MRSYPILAILFCLSFLSCSSQATNNGDKANADSSINSTENLKYDTSIKTIHLFVALCDNKYQGIVPVPEKVGNGQDPNANLYWGCGFGIKTYFKKSKEWTLIKEIKSDEVRLERLIFKHHSKPYYLVADAYDGKYIKQCTTDFLKSSCGQFKDTLHVNNRTIGVAGNADLVGYIGHDGLMDFKITEDFKNTDNKKRDIIILACYSKTFFSKHLGAANINPLVWTTGLMCPEAYTVHDAITGYVQQESNQQIRNRAANAYSKYQKCSLKAAQNLLVTGW